MSSLPGFSLESFLLWNFDLVVDGQDEANVSLGLAEAIGNIKPRPRMSPEKFAALVAIYEPHRERVEYLLSDFDEETQSWRTYAYYCFDWLPELSSEQRAALGLG